MHNLRAFNQVVFCGEVLIEFKTPLFCFFCVCVFFLSLGFFREGLLTLPLPPLCEWYIFFSPSLYLLLCVRVLPPRRRSVSVLVARRCPGIKRASGAAWARPQSSSGRGIDGDLGCDTIAASTTGRAGRTQQAGPRVPTPAVSHLEGSQGLVRLSPARQTATAAALLSSL